jgi:hypothetical protein
LNLDIEIWKLFGIWFLEFGILIMALRKENPEAESKLDAGIRGRK